MKTTHEKTTDQTTPDHKITKEKPTRPKNQNQWNTYRTRFLVQAKQLSEPLTFTDALDREHRGQPGDYLVQSSDGTTRIAPQAIFEDIYVAISAPYQNRKSIKSTEMNVPTKGTQAWSASA